MQVELLQHFFRAGEHALVLVARLLRRGDRDEFDLGELVLADHAARILAGGAGLGAEARRQAVNRIGNLASSTMDSRTRLVSGTSAVGMSQSR